MIIKMLVRVISVRISVASKAYRDEKLLNAVQKKGYIKTGEAASLLEVSECSIRRIFAELEERGCIVRMRGGARANQANKGGEYHFDSLQMRQSEQKARIGSFASTLIENGDNVFLDTGTTIQQAAYHLAERIRTKQVLDVKVYTNSLRNLNILMDCCEVNLIGGMFRSKRQDFCGYLSEMVLEFLSFDKCFLSADGVSLQQNDGVMATDVSTAKINQIITKRAGQTFLLVDATKFMKRSLIKYMNIEYLKMIITDTSLDDEAAEAISAMNVLIQRV